VDSSAVEYVTLCNRRAYCHQRITRFAVRCVSATRVEGVLDEMDIVVIVFACIIVTFINLSLLLLLLLL